MQGKEALDTSINRLLEESIAPEADFDFGNIGDKLINIMSTRTARTRSLPAS